MSLGRMPTVSPVPQSAVYGNDLHQALELAADAAATTKDSFVGTPHLLIGLLEDKNVV